MESPDFEILLFGYSVDGGEVKVIDLASGETLPKEVPKLIGQHRKKRIAKGWHYQRHAVGFVGFQPPA